MVTFVRQGLLVVAAVAFLGATALAALAFVELSLAALAAGVGFALARIMLDQREANRLLQTQRTAQRASYERMRLILEARKSPDAPDQAVRGSSASSSPETVEAEHPRIAEITSLVAGARYPTSVLAIGDGPLSYSAPSDSKIVFIQLGSDALAEIPHGTHSHILIEPAELRNATAQELVWLRRAFRWQHDTVIAASTTDAPDPIGPVQEALGVPVGSRKKEGFVLLSTPLGGSDNWGAER